MLCCGLQACVLDAGAEGWMRAALPTADLTRSEKGLCYAKLRKLWVLSDTAAAAAKSLQ